MKKRMILPLLAIAFAIASAFVTLPSQTAWFKSPMGSVESGTITTPPASRGITCEAEGQQICQVGGINAYESSEDAAAQTQEGLLRYDDVN